MGKKENETSKSFRLGISLSALNDLDEITDFITYVNEQPLNAIKVGDAIFDTIDKIRKNPFVYKECEAIPTKTKLYRQAVCMSWLIIYKIMKNEIRVLGIIHGARKPAVIKKLKKVK
jgi:plasmid stabilization system protein ParE